MSLSTRADRLGLGAVPRAQGRGAARDEDALTQAFTFCGQALNGAVPTGESVLLVLDTNVVSVIDSACRRGLDLTKPGHRRVLHLVEWMRTRPGSHNFPWYGVVESAGFHSGGISARNFMARGLAVYGVLRWAA